MTCALRALSLCDGHQLEDPDRALTPCLCTKINYLRRRGFDDLARHAADELQGLIEETMAPALPLPL